VTDIFKNCTRMYIHQQEMCGEQIKPAQGCLNSGISYLIHVWCL